MRPPEFVALVLSIGLALAVVGISIGAAWELANPSAALSEGAVQLLSTVLGAIAGGLAGYLGTGRRDD